MAYNFALNPLKFLQSSIGSEIVIRLKDGTEYKGNLKKYDNFMNVMLSKAEKIPFDAEKPLKESEKEISEEIFIRGNNVLFILPGISK